MTKRLDHRGPDAEGIFIDDEHGIGLGHKRLSILDLSPAANQPFYSSCGNYVMTYNGEVYNYAKIREEVSSVKSIDFRSTSDTEVILEAFVIWGPEFVKRLNGMFTIAIWGKKEHKLWIFRDRLGIKPLYYYHHERTFAFASELKSFKAPYFSRTRSDQAISLYLHLGFIPEPLSIYSEVKKFPAGCYGTIERGEVTIVPYWKITDHISRQRTTNADEARDKLKELLIRSVERRMIADVPLGVFLSGGIDSSTITAVAQSISPKPVRTFSIGIKDNKYAEASYARLVADSLKTDHQEYMLDEQEAIERVAMITDTYDEPFADSSSIPTLLVSELASRSVKVVLSGDGGDEQFLGYGSYNWAQRLSNPLFQLGRKPISKLLAITGSNRLKRGSHVMDYPNKQVLKSHILSQEEYMFAQRELEEILPGPFADLPNETMAPVARTLTAREEQAIFDINNYLKDDLLVKVDRASMKYSLEARVPLLDHEIVEFTINLDEQLKVRGGTTKYLLRQILYDYLNPKLFDRPKWGFSIPLDKWLRGELNYLVAKYLNPDLIQEQQVLNPKQVSALLQRFYRGEDYLYNRIWALVLLNKWIAENSQ